MYQSISCPVGKVVSWLRDWRKWKERVKGRGSGRHFLFVSLWAWWEEQIWTPPAVTSLIWDCLKGNGHYAFRKGSLSPAVACCMCLCLSETVYSSFPISWISYVESFFATKRASPASQWFSLKKKIHMFQKTSQLLWLLHINIVLCFRNLMSVFLSSSWVEQQCWVLASGPWWRRATTWVCWLPALLQSQRTPWSWLVAWWWWQASWAAALSSGSRKAVCPWWGGGPCLFFFFFLERFKVSY